MIDIEKIEKTIDSLEQSSIQFSNISAIITGVRDIIEKVKEEKIEISQAHKELKEASTQLSIIGKDLKRYETDLNTTITKLISDMNSKNIKIFEAYKEELTFNMNAFKTDITSTTLTAMKTNS